MVKCPVCKKVCLRRGSFQLFNGFWVVDVCRNCYEVAYRRTNSYKREAEAVNYA